MDWREVPAFYATLAGQSGMAAQALMFTCLTGCRTSEVLQAVWSEFDFDGRIWVIPCDRTKTDTVRALDFQALSVTCNGKEIAMPAPVSERVQKRRDALRAAGLRPVQIWVPDTRRPGFANECRRQAALVARADRRDARLDDFMDAALSDLDNWE